MTLHWQTLSFHSLSNLQLYSMLRLRSEVFVVEQNCIYQDLDNYDQDAHHVIATNPEHEVVCCARIIAPGIKYKGASIGRIVTSPSLRATGQGKNLLAQAVSACESLHGACDISISAQQHLERFYNDFGFVTQSDPYLEDDIPHVCMTRAVIND